MVCVPCSQSHFSRCFEDLMLWGRQILFRIFWKVWTVSPEITHTRHPPPLPTSLTHTALSFPSFLHSLSYTFTSSLEQRHWFCIQFHSVGRLRGASWVTSPLDPRTGLLRARNRVLGPNPLLGMDRKMLKLPALGRSISHVSWVSSPHPYHQRAGSQGSWEQSSAHIECGSPRTPGSKRPGGAMTPAPRGRVGCPDLEFPDSPPWGCWVARIVVMRSLFALRSLVQMFQVTEQLLCVFTVVTCELWKTTNTVSPPSSLMPSSMSCHRRLSYGVTATRPLCTPPIGSTCK